MIKMHGQHATLVFHGTTPLPSDRLIRPRTSVWSKCLLLALALITSCFAIAGSGQSLKVGERFPIEQFSPDRRNINTIVAFVPSLTYDTEYASMMTQGFYYYFYRRLSFPGNATERPETRIIYVVHAKQNEGRSTQNLTGDAKVIYDRNGSLFKQFGVKEPAHINDDSTIAIIDRIGDIAYVDDAYRSQGEHLKPLENKIKELNGRKISLPTVVLKDIKVGRNAPNFQVNGKEQLSDMRGSVVLLSFYPAAFSGVLPRPKLSEEDLVVLSGNLKLPSTRSMSCAFQIESLDKLVVLPSMSAKPPMRRIAISRSSAALLTNWGNLLGTHNIEYASDLDFSVASAYSAYNTAGYHNRVSVVIDKKGKIAYIDQDYSLVDESIMNEKIDRLLAKK